MSLPLFGILNIVALLVVWAFLRHPTWLKPTAPRPRTKSPILYWFWRIFVALVFIGFAVTWFAAMTTPSEKALLRMVYWFPFLTVAIFVLFTAFAFPFKYSMFGELRRTSLPEESPVRTVESTGVIIGKLRCNGPFATWLFYRNGIGIKIAFIGTAFLPVQQIVAIEVQRGLACTLYHDSPELSAPIRLPRRVALVIAEMLAPHYPERVIFEAQLANPGGWLQRLWS